MCRHLVNQSEQLHLDCTSCQISPLPPPLRDDRDRESDWGVLGAVPSAAVYERHSKCICGRPNIFHFSMWERSPVPWAQWPVQAYEIQCVFDPREFPLPDPTGPRSVQLFYGAGALGA